MTNHPNRSKRPKWQPIDTLPEVTVEQRFRFLVFSRRIGVCSASGGSMNGYQWVDVSTFTGNAIENWGVTHWMPLPAPPTDLDG